MTSSKTSFAKGGKDQTCYCCSKKRHITPECLDQKIIEKKNWFICKTQLNAEAENQQVEQGDEESTLDTSMTSSNASSDRRAAWSGLQALLEPLRSKASTAMMTKKWEPN